MDNIINSVDYAISANDFFLFDYLTKDLSAFSTELKNEIIFHVIIDSENTDFIAHAIGRLGYDITFKDSDGFSFLHIAASSKYPQTVQFFIDKGLNIEEKTSLHKGTPLMIAAESSSNVEVLKVLVEAGADINTKADDGKTLIIVAGGHNPNPQVTEYLLSLGCDFEERDSQGFTALLYGALWQSNPEVLDLLVQAGADCYAKTNEGKTMLHLAAANTNSCIVDYVLNVCNTSHFNTSQPDRLGQTALQTVLLYGNNCKSVRMFLDKMKEEHLMYASMNENEEILEELIQAGYDVNTTDSDGKSVMMMVARNNPNPEVIEMLLRHNAIWYNQDARGRNVLHYAASNNSSQIYDYMLNDEKFKTLAFAADKAGQVPNYYLANKDVF